MFLIFILQLISEFFPISSSLFLRTLNMESESIIFHIFSGILFTIIHFKQLSITFLRPKENWKTIMFYFFSTLPSVIVGYYTDIKQIVIFSEFKLEYSLLFNILSAIFLLCIIYRNKKKSKSLYYDQYKKEENTLSIMDGFLMGVFASLNGFFPGLSRLGMCLSYLLIKNKNIEKAYEVSIITSIPILIGKPAVLLYKNFNYMYMLIDFVKTYYILIIIFNIFTVYLEKHIRNLFSLKSLSIMMILRIVYYGSYLIYRLYI